VYGFHAWPEQGLTVHAPGSVAAGKASDAGVEFTVTGWPAGEYYVLVSGLKAAPRVRLGGKDAPVGASFQYLPGGNLILKVKNPAAAPKAGAVHIDLGF